MPEDLAQILGSLGAYGTDQGALDAAERAGVERARIEVRGNVDNIWNSILREARAHQGKLEALVGEASGNYPDQAQRLSRALVVYRQLHAGVNGLEPTRAGKQATGPRSDTTKGPREFDPFLELRRLFAIYWQPLISLIALVPTLLSVLRWAGFQVRVWPAQANLLTQSIVIGLGIITLIVIRNPKIAYRLTRWLVPPPAPLPDRPRVFRGPVSYDVQDAEQFHGRDADGEACWERLRRKPFFILEGESGCGKSSLLNVHLIPRAREVFHVVGPCRCGEDPFGKLRSQLTGERYERGRNYGKEALVEAIEEVARAPANGPARPLLVCIDQFEELFVTVKDEVRRQFFEALKESIEAGRLRLVLAIRKDFSDLLLDACRQVDPDMASLAFDRQSYYVLRSFAEDQAEGVVLRMLDREELHGNNPLRQQELREFARALVLELLRPPLDARLCPEDKKLVLPVELQMVGWTYESLLPVRSFTAVELRRRGGKVGLYRDYIEDAKEYAFRRTGVPGATAILVLRRLISPAGTRWPQSVRQIADSGLGLSTPQVEAVLQALAERYLVRRLPDEGAGAVSVSGGVASRRYELLHEHLVQLLAEAPEPALQQARDAEARLRFWLDRTRNAFAPHALADTRTRWSWLHALGSGGRDALRMPMPLGETLGLWRHARDPDARQMLRRSLRAFLVRSGLVLAAVLIPSGTWWIAQEIRERSPSYQVEYIVSRAPMEIVNSASALGLDVQQASLEWLAALVKAGQFDAAMAAAAKITAPALASRAYAAVAEAAAKAGQLDVAEAAIDAAMAAAAKITNPWDFNPFAASSAYTAVAEAAAKAGQLDAVLAAAAKITFPYSASRAYAAVAEAAAKAGQLDAAMAAAAKITDPTLASRAYAAVAEAAAKAGQLDAAVAAAAKITNPTLASSAYAAVAKAAAKAGQLDAVLAAVAKITDPFSASSAYAAVAAAAAKAGQVELATQAEAGIPSHLPVPKSNARRAIAEALARAGRFYEARVHCDRCGDLDKLKAYTVILQEYTNRHPPDAPPVRRRV